jgi:hypothetical protein
MIHSDFDINVATYPHSFKYLFKNCFIFSLLFWIPVLTSYLSFDKLDVSMPHWFFYYASFVLIVPFCFLLCLKIRHWNTPPRIIKYTTDLTKTSLYKILLMLYMLSGVFAFFLLPDLSLLMISLWVFFAVFSFCRSLFIFHKLKQQAKQLNYPWVNLVVQQDHIEYVHHTVLTLHSAPKGSLLDKFGAAVTKVLLYLYPAVAGIGYFLNKAGDSGAAFMVVLLGFFCMFLINAVLLHTTIWSLYEAYLLRQVQKQHNKPIYRYR